MKRGMQAAIVIAIAMASGIAWAGEPACEGQRVDEAGDCEVQAGEACQEACDEIGYVRTCATQLTTSCRDQCTHTASGPPVDCAVDCDALCEAQCDEGFVVVCAHNCFDECTVACPDTCADALDPQQCRASCEATCDVECDVRCEALAPGASCYDHCQECCAGACSARGQMDCQLSCQRERFSVCETDQAGRCAESCDDGVLVCDDQFITAQAGIGDCADALRERGVDVRDDRNITVLDPAPYGCGCRGGRPPGWAWWLVAIAFVRRRGGDLSQPGAIRHRRS